VILCGGSGTRLWPLSRELFPKQLLSLVSESSLLQDTVARLSGLASDPIVVCNDEHRFLVADQLREAGTPASAILLEPVGRNTAPAVAVAALAALDNCPNSDDAVLLVLPSDHVIENVNGFQKAVMKGAEVASDGCLVTFGVVPNSPETGYGYIRAGDDLKFPGSFAVAEFVEKPDLETAKGYVSSGDFFWNSGMFMFRALDYLSALEAANQPMKAACDLAYSKAEADLGFVRLDKKSFENCPPDSIDYAVMERADNAAVIPIDVNWSDVGSWSALYDISDQDENGNVLLGDVIAQNTSGSYLRSDHHLMAAVGVSNLIVVETADAVLVADKSKVQDVKKVVERLKTEKREEHLLHRRVYRPWGSYESVDEGPSHKVKRIRVNPGARLSLQMHHHRAEHWVVVKGTAEVVNGDETIILQENESTFIPMGTRHRLSNPGQDELEIIEVQSGDYHGEDDIVRFEDEYGR
jgi:mannose-1-phosphate guanylyltransferase/mannose-6-phosphate isomerase